MLWILAAEAVGALSGFLTRDGAQLYRDTLAGVDRTAALLQLPCLLWVAFAGYLNLGARLLN